MSLASTLSRAWAGLRRWALRLARSRAADAANPADPLEAARAGLAERYPDAPAVWLEAAARAAMHAGPGRSTSRPEGVPSRPPAHRPDTAPLPARRRTGESRPAPFPEPAGRRPGRPRLVAAEPIETAGVPVPTARPLLATRPPRPRPPAHRPALALPEERIGPGKRDPFRAVPPSSAALPSSVPAWSEAPGSEDPRPFDSAVPPPDDRPQPTFLERGEPPYQPATFEPFAREAEPVGDHWPDLPPPSGPLERRAVPRGAVAARRPSPSWNRDAIAGRDSATASPIWRDAPSSDRWPSLPEPDGMEPANDEIEADRESWTGPRDLDRLARIQERR